MAEQMRTILWGSNRGSRRLHIEAPGCIVNITKNLHDTEGREVTRIDIKCDDYSGDPAVTMPDFTLDPEKLAAAVRAYKAIDDDNRAGIKITPDRWADAHQQAEAALVEKPYKFLGVRVRKDAANA